MAITKIFYIRTIDFIVFYWYALQIVNQFYEYNIIDMHKIEFFLKKLLMTYFFMSGKDPFSPVIPDLNSN